MGKIIKRVSKCFVAALTLSILVATSASDGLFCRTATMKHIVDYSVLDSVQQIHTMIDQQQENEKVTAVTVKVSIKAKESKVQIASRQNTDQVWIDYKLTHYVANCDGCSGFTKTEFDVRKTTKYQGYKIISVDVRKIALGTIVEIDDGEVIYKAIAIDTGGAIKGKKLDLLVGSYKEAINLGVKNIKLRVVRDGWDEEKK